MLTDNSSLLTLNGNRTALRSVIGAHCNAPGVDTHCCKHYIVQYLYVLHCHTATLSGASGVRLGVAHFSVLSLLFSYSTPGVA